MRSSSWHAALNWLTVAVWTGLIFWFSSQPDLRSALPTWQDAVLRKAAHIAEYFVLAYLWARTTPRGLNAWRSELHRVSLGTLATASMDELYQRLVPGRHGSPADVLIDILGVGAFLLLRLPVPLRR